MSYDINKLVEKVVNEVKTSNTQTNGTSTPTMTLELARRLTEKVKVKAKQTGVKAVVAVTDAGGNIVTVDRMDDAFIASVDIAVNKAYTSVALKMSTYELSKLALPSGPLYGIQHTNNGRIVIFGGGVPLKVGDAVIGGLGVSGGTAEQDTYLGNCGEEIFQELVK